jgi:hypothetical protein
VEAPDIMNGIFGAAAARARNEIRVWREKAPPSRSAQSQTTSVTVAEQLHGLIAPRGIDHVACHQAMAREAALVGQQAVFVLDPALDEIESEARKSPLGLAGANRRYSPRPGLS